MVLRGNYSQHNYPHRFSQGENFQLDGDGFLVEHNVIRSSSWPVRGMGGELRYNLIDASGNSDQVFQAPMSNTNIHHNIFSFTVSQTFYSPGAGLSLIYNVDNVQFHNNVMDGGGTFMGFAGSPVSVTAGSFIGSLRNNVFYNFAGLAGGPVLAGDLGESTNPPLSAASLFRLQRLLQSRRAQPDELRIGRRWDRAGAAGYGMHDLGGFNGHVNPKFTAAHGDSIPLPAGGYLEPHQESFGCSGNLPRRCIRRRRAVRSSAPEIRRTDTGGNIGAVGNGEAADQFGLFGAGSGTPPAPPVIASFTASPLPCRPGQSVTLNWSVSGATTLSITPGAGNRHRHFSERHPERHHHLHT